MEAAKDTGSRAICVSLISIGAPAATDTTIKPIASGVSIGINHSMATASNGTRTKLATTAVITPGISRSGLTISCTE
jgi:hypothetical protein